MDIAKTDMLLQYILSVAGQNEFGYRELGQIHIIKYAYLADLSHAKHHGGKTYTGIPWVFHHFGPWSVDCFNRIDPALEAIGALKKTIESVKYDDFFRWSISDDRLFEKLDNQIELSVCGAVQKYVKQFGSDTYGLLDFIYKTEPMINAAPEEMLDFNYAITEAVPAERAKKQIALTARQKKKQRQKIQQLKEKINQKLDKRIKEQAVEVCPIPPRYDGVFFEGLSKLDEEAGTLPSEGKYLAVFDTGIWKSKARHDPELS